MKLLCLFVAVSLISWSHGFNGFLPEPDCYVDEDIVNCTCTSRKNVVIQSFQDGTIQGIEIRHCGNVTIQISAFQGLSLHYLVLDDLLNLDIKPLAFLALEFLEYLQVSNIPNLKNTEYSIHLSNISKVLFLNVSAQSLKSRFLEIDTVTHFVMTNCHFHTVDYLAFRLYDAQFVFIMNSSIEVMQSDAFHLNGTTNQVYVQNTSFKFIEQEAFYAENLMHLTFQNCSFDLLQSHFAVGQVAFFAFFQNQVGMAETEAFSELNVTIFYWLVNNNFEQAKAGFLSLPMHSVENVTVENNTFVCECQLSWMWTPRYENLRNTSLCVQEDGIHHATDLKVLSQQGQCTDLVQVDHHDEVSSSMNTNNASLASESRTNSSSISILRSGIRCDFMTVAAVLFLAIFK